MAEALLSPHGVITKGVFWNSNIDSPTEGAWTEGNVELEMIQQVKVTYNHQLISSDGVYIRTEGLVFHGLG